MSYFKEETKNENRIDILPMIDIIFSILAFLIISSLYLTRVDTISVDLPKASSATKQKKKFVNVSINKSGDLFINRKNIKLQDLNITVTDLVGESNDLIVINADKNVPHGYVINVLDMLRKIDDLKLAISTKYID
tara:strand:- start:95 stop:499 length:405 start_codon:yes stop_codon:yes gene_type:complete